MITHRFLSVSRRPLILVLTGGGPLDVSFSKEDPRIASILWVGYPGEGGGKALTQVVLEIIIQVSIELIMAFHLTIQRCIPWL